MDRRLRKIEILLVENFYEIDAGFNFLTDGIPDGYEICDFQVSEMKDGYVLKSTIKEMSGVWYAE